MGTSQMIVGIICLVVAGLLGVYVSFTLRGKGPILSNTYIWLSEEEKKQADRKAEYKLVSVVFGLLALAALCEGMFVFTEMKLFAYMGAVFIGIDIAYAILKSYKSINK